MSFEFPGQAAKKSPHEVAMDGGQSPEWNQSRMPGMRFSDLPVERRSSNGAKEKMKRTAILVSKTY
jgi:hypothetical protein